MASGDEQWSLARQWLAVGERRRWMTTATLTVAVMAMMTTIENVMMESMEWRPDDDRH